jgi:hypothetical protein
MDKIGFKVYYKDLVRIFKIFPAMKNEHLEDWFNRLVLELEEGAR